MKVSKVLLVDAFVNLILGFMLLFLSEKLIHMLGVTTATQHFYPTILGGVLVGIGIALHVEYFRIPGGLVGLGLGGAIVINLCGGLVLAAWLLFGKLDIPFRGQVLIWILVFILVFISVVELFVHMKKNASDPSA